MQPFILISIVVFGLITFGALILFIVWMRRSNTEASLVGDDELRPQGYWVGLGLSLGAGFGVAIGTALGNIALGLPIGVGAGIAIGAALEQKNKDKLRPLNEQEKKMQKWGVALGVLLLLIFMGLFVFLFFLRAR